MEGQELVLITLEQVEVVELQRQAHKVFLFQVQEDQDLVEQEPQHL